MRDDGRVAKRNEFITGADPLVALKAGEKVAGTECKKGVEQKEIEKIESQGAVLFLVAGDQCHGEEQTL